MSSGGVKLYRRRHLAVHAKILLFVHVIQTSHHELDETRSCELLTLRYSTPHLACPALYPKRDTLWTETHSRILLDLLCVSFARYTTSRSYPVRSIRNSHRPRLGAQLGN